jgi:hypothetical protein
MCAMAESQAHVGLHPFQHAFKQTTLLKMKSKEGG